MKNKRRILIIIITLLLTVIGGSYAWFSYASRQSALVLTIGDLTDTRMIITPYHINDTILPVNTYTSGVVSSIETINNRNNPTSIILYYRINELDEVLIDNGLKYTITKSSSKNGTYTHVVTDDFSDISNNQLVVLDTKVNASSTTYYKVYVWLDSSVGNQSELQNLTLDIELNGTIFQMPEAPVIQDGMIPVTIADNGAVTAVSETNPDWYNYDKQEWANMVLVTDSSRSKYLGKDNVSVTTSDILAYYVWVPRYKYRIPNVACSSIPETERDVLTNPECFTAPYSVSEEEKLRLMEYYADYAVCDTLENNLDWVTSEFENAFETGYLANGYSIVDLVKGYNDNNGYGCVFQVEGPDILLMGTFSRNSLVTAARTIDISFESSSAKLLVGDAVNNYRSHSAFWWDNDNDGVVDSDETLAGMWVGKFETTPDKSSTCYSSPSTTNCNNTTQNPTILPDEASLRYQYIGRQFATSQNISKGKNIYGLSSAVTDAHMAKNSEWGAVAYLSHSQYGINDEIRINNYWNSTNNKYTLTGCGAASDNASGSTTCSIPYGSGVTEYPQSTTGNITGVFDMSGGAWENVMGNYNNTKNSTYFSILPSKKYYNVYLSSLFTGNSTTNISLCTLETCGGHALNETKGWYNDYSYFSYSSSPWFTRGGSASNGVVAGAFGSYYTMGSNSGDSSSWRSVIVAAKDLVPPTCTLYATNEGVSFEIYSDDVVSTGLSTSSTVTYNGTELLPLDYGTYYGYVKDAAGNTGSCSVTVTSTKQYTNYDYIGCDEETMSDVYAACGSWGEDYVSNSCSKNNYYQKNTYYCIVEDYLITCEDGTQKWFMAQEWKEINSSTDGPWYVCMDGGMPMDYEVSGGNSFWEPLQTNYVTLANCTYQSQPYDCDMWSLNATYSSCNSSYIVDTSYSGSITCSYSYMDCEDGWYVNDSYCYTTN